MISFCDVRAINAALQRELQSAVTPVLANGRFILSEEVAGFEREAADYLGVAHAIGVASGTDALALSLAAFGIGPGDEVLLPSATFFAAAEAIARVHASPVPTDSLDIADLSDEFTSATRAIIVPSLYGAAVEVDALLSWAQERELVVIEDACQAFGAKLAGQSAGTRGQAGCFSFYPTKVLGGAGDGGLIVTNNSETASLLRQLRRHGANPENKYEHQFLGTNSRLDEVQAAFLRVKLQHLDSAIAKRRLLAARYQELLSPLPWLQLPAWRAQARDTYYAFSIRCERRDSLRSYLLDHGIEAPVHYPQAIHRQPAFITAFRAPTRELSTADAWARTNLSLPCHPALEVLQVEQVCQAIHEFGARN